MSAIAMELESANFFHESMYVKPSTKQLKVQEAPKLPNIDYPKLPNNDYPKPPKTNPMKDRILPKDTRNTEVITNCLSVGQISMVRMFVNKITRTYKWLIPT